MLESTLVGVAVAIGLSDCFDEDGASAVADADPDRWVKSRSWVSMAPRTGYEVLGISHLQGLRKGLEPGSRTRCSGSVEIEAGPYWR